jgi:hypothetical protein
MKDLREALADIHAIRHQVALNTQFRGYGPASIAASGLLALAIASGEAHWRNDAHDFPAFLTIWVGAAAISVALTALEAITRARRVHSGYASQMIRSAADQFLPAVTISVLLTVVFARVAPQELWTLPGIWQLMFSLGVFSSCRFLPKPTFAVGIWYLVAGLFCLVVQSATRDFSPWSMGIPFGVGQLLVAGILRFGFRETGADAQA